MRAPRSQELDGLLATRPEIAAAPGSERLVPDLTMSHRTPAVRALLAGLPVDACGEMGVTALHRACWKGYADHVELLLDHGASLTIEDPQFHGTPPGWFGHGVHNCGEGAGDYPRVARLLIAAGATIRSVDLPTGKPDVDAVLREHGLIWHMKQASPRVGRGAQGCVRHAYWRWGECKVWEFANRIGQIANGTFRVKPGWLFPALHAWKRRDGWPRPAENRKATGAPSTTRCPRPSGAGFRRKPASGKRSR